MPIVERDTKQPGVYHFRESPEEERSRVEKEDLKARAATLETALAELQAREAARDPAYRPSVDLAKRKTGPKTPDG